MVSIDDFGMADVFEEGSLESRRSSFDNGFYCLLVNIKAMWISTPNWVGKPDSNIANFGRNDAVGWLNETSKFKQMRVHISQSSPRIRHHLNRVRRPHPFQNTGVEDDARTYILLISFYSIVKFSSNHEWVISEIILARYVQLWRQRPKESRDFKVERNGQV